MPDNVDPQSQHDATPNGAGGETGALIRARRQAIDWSLEDLARRIGTQKGYLSEVERGIKPPPGDEMLTRIEQFMMMRPGELVAAARWERMRRAGGPGAEAALARAQSQGEVARRLAELLRAKGEGAKTALDRAFESGELRRLVDRLAPLDAGANSGPSRSDELTRRSTTGSAQASRAGERFGLEPLAHALPIEVPLINKVAAGYPREFTDLGYPARVADEYVRCPDVSDPDAFAARVVGDSMSPEYREGDVIVFSPAREVKSGADCFVRLERDAETTFKRVYFETGPEGEELIRLQPINNAHAPRVLPREDVAGLYAAVKAIREVRNDVGSG